MNSVLLEILFYVAFFFLFLKGAKRKREADEDFSKTTAQSLKGICCLAIFGHHYGQVSGEPALSLFTHLGYLVLNVFFMISGYGVSYGLKNKENYLNTFLLRRCGRVILCYWIMNGITVVAEYVFAGKISIGGVKRGIRIFFLRDASYTPSSWYIMMLFWLYFSFYLVAHLGEKYIQILMFLAVSGIVAYNIRRGMPLWYYNYLYSFNIGIYMVCGKKPERREKIFAKLICSLGVFILLFALSKIDRILIIRESLRLILDVAAIISSTAIAIATMFLIRLIRIESKVLYIFGSMSTGIYVFHTCIMLRPEIQFEMVEYIKNWGVCFWISLGITILVSLGVKWLLEREAVKIKAELLK